MAGEGVRGLSGSEGRGAFCPSVAPSLEGPGMEVMNFLNEAVSRYPRAISFAAGRPPDRFLPVGGSQRWLQKFVAHRAEAAGIPESAVWASLGQYSDTNGMIGDLIAKFLASSEGLCVDPAAIIVTNGFQEALATVLLGLFDRETDAVLAADPTYVGLTGAARIAGIPVEPLSCGMPICDALSEALRAVRRAGRRPVGLYVIPDFSNPSGGVLGEGERRALLEMAGREDLLLLEDTAYRAFAYDGERLPSLKALDEEGRVMVLGSFAKTVMPGLRLGYVVADQGVGPSVSGRRGWLAQELSKVKSFLSVATSPIAQAILGGLLLEQGFSLAAWNAPKIEACRRQRQAMLDALDRTFGDDPELRAQVTWTRPGGGFFLTLKLPFEFGEPELTACARDYGVIACPMTFFSLRGGFRDQVRLTFSNVDEGQISAGIERLYRFVKSHGDAASPIAAAAED
jgi:(S)-3,5-dihydroxyphenylglycine transaminase